MPVKKSEVKEKKTFMEHFNTHHLQGKEGKLRLITLGFGLSETIISIIYSATTNNCQLESIIIFLFLQLHFLFSVCWTIFICFDSKYKKPSSYDFIQRLDMFIQIIGSYFIITIFMIFGMYIGWSFPLANKTCDSLNVINEIHYKYIKLSCEIKDCDLVHFVLKLLIVFSGFIYGSINFKLGNFLLNDKKMIFKKPES